MLLSDAASISTKYASKSVLLLLCSMISASKNSLPLFTCTFAPQIISAPETDASSLPVSTMEYVSSISKKIKEKRDSCIVLVLPVILDVKDLAKKGRSKLTWRGCVTVRTCSGINKICKATLTRCAYDLFLV